MNLLLFKKISLCATVAMLPFVSSNAQFQLRYFQPYIESSETSFEANELVGNVKNVDIYHDDVLQYSFVCEANTILKKYSYDGGNKILDMEATFAENKKELATIMLRDLLAKDKNNWAKIEYERDKNNLNSEISRYFSMDGDKKKYTGKSVKEYDESGVAVIKTASYQDNDRVSSFTDYKYEKNPNDSKKPFLIESAHFLCLHNCDFSSSQKFTYNKKGQVETKVNEGFMASKETFSYNDKGLLVGHTNMMDDKKYNSTETFEYNEKQQLTRWTTKTKQATYEQVFEYDNYGNWIKQTYLENGKKQLIRKRVISYQE